MDKNASVLAPAIGKYAHVFMDDVIIFGKDAQQHKRDIEAVVEL